MTREIKFRAWDKKTKSMIREVFEVGLGDRHCPEKWLVGDDRQTDNFELMQYTGFKDKSGKEIYEGDILRSDVYSAEKSKHFEIFFKKDGYFVSSKRTKQNWKIGEEYRLTEWLKYFSKNQIEIVGNIYENPKLLEEND